MSGRIVSRLGPELFRIDLSGRFYTAELSAGHGRDLAPGDPVFVCVVSKSGNKAFLEIVDSKITRIDSPRAEDLERLANAAGRPGDPAAIAMVEALVERRLPLRSDYSDRLYRHLKTMDIPTAAAARQFLIDFPPPNA